MNNLELYPTLITPFDEEGCIDGASLDRLIALFADAGCDGVFAVCQSSEMFFLTDEEKLDLAHHTLQLCRKYGLKCVVSGHTQDALEDQIRYLRALEALQPDAIILVSNRLAAPDESDAVALRNLHTLCGALSPRTRLGIYECPYPYKRLLTPELLDFIASEGRFAFVKDTCCQADVLRQRIERLRGTGVKLYNANAATLLSSLDDGAAGYSGVMLNLMPEFFSLLKQAAAQGNRSRMQLACAHISAASVIEYQNYPANAKYALQKRGILTSTRTRNGRPGLTESQQKEMDAFLEVNRWAYFHLLPHATVQTLFRPDTAFCECHASSVLPWGDRVLAAYFAGAHEKADDVGIWLSVRQGEVWNAPRRIAKVNETPHWNPVLFDQDDGRIALVFKVGREIPEWRSYIQFSDDGGQTWTEAEPLDAANPAGGPVRCKPLRLSSGELLAPCSDEGETGWFPRVDLSTDGGGSFARLAEIPLNRTDAARPDYLAGAGAIQPTLWESAPGHVHALLRTTAGRIFRSDSADGGRTWCTAYPTNLPNNNSGIDLTQVNGALYLVLNPVGGNWAARTPLMLMRSLDNGAHFTEVCVLCDTPLDDVHGRTSEFSYPAIVARGGMLYITFTHQRKTIAFCQLSLSQL